MRISDWSSDVCSSDLIGINPLVPFNAGLGDARGGAPVDDANDGQRLVNGGLPAVLSQTFRTLLQSRMHVGLARYAQQYPGIDQMVFEPNDHDGELFPTNAFSFAARRRVCTLAWRNTIDDLRLRAGALRPVLAAHDIRLRHEVPHA